MSLGKWKIGLAVVVAVGLPLGAAAMQWPDTEQRSCYDNEKIIPCPIDESSPFYGQDAQYDGPPHSYTKLGQDGVELDDSATEWIMVRDNVTGLIWELKDNHDGTQDYTNPHDADNTYSWCKRSISAGLCGDKNTEDFISAINAEGFGGYTDWRLPTVHEIVSLADLKRLNASPDIGYFKLTFYSSYWTADRDLSSNSQAWGCNLVYPFKSSMSTLMRTYAVRNVN